MKDLGVTYNGKPIDHSYGHAMCSCAVFAVYAYCREAVLLLERVDPKPFGAHTKVMH